MATLSLKTRLERFLFITYVKLWILMTIKLPDEFNNVISRLNSLGDYNVVEAYFDKKDHQINNGTKDLRSYLGLDPSHVLCDGFCKINFSGMGLKNVLLEDKDTSGERGVFKAHKQLFETAKALRDKYGIKQDYAIITQLKLSPSFEALPYSNTQLKYIRSTIGRKVKSFNIEYSNNIFPILIGKS